MLERLFDKDHPVNVAFEQAFKNTPYSAFLSFNPETNVTVVEIFENNVNSLADKYTLTFNFGFGDKTACMSDVEESLALYIHSVVLAASNLFDSLLPPDDVVLAKA